MPLAKCPRTGKLFDNANGLVHPSAEAVEEEDYVKILDYLVEHPNAKSDEVVASTGVTHECIARMIKSGRVKEMDTASLLAQAEEYAERSAEVARRNQQLASEIGSVIRQASPTIVSTTESASRSVRSTLESKRSKL